MTDRNSPSYYGSFDGNSKKVTYTLSSSSTAALFKTLGRSVKNLTLTGLAISSSSDAASLAITASSATVTGITLESSSITSSGSNVKGTVASPIKITGTKASYIGSIVGYAENGTYGTAASPDKVQFITVTGSASQNEGKGDGAWGGAPGEWGMAKT